ncbi:ATP-binding protein [Streptomyces laurentii]|uniref:ATP-binding protein n=1 Tax=Streptomyces laurentii TaxID=39478 RepID=UPI0036A534A7
MFQAPPPRNRLLLADTPNAIGLARLHTTDVLSRWHVHPESIETAKLLMSELATNAVRHPNDATQQDPLSAQLPTARSFEIALEIMSGIVRLSVWDRDTRPPMMKQAGMDAIGGRGLLLVDAMSRCWGYYAVPGGPGKVVWAEVQAHPAGGDQEESEASGRYADFGLAISTEKIEGAFGGPEASTRRSSTVPCDRATPSAFATAAC